MRIPIRGVHCAAFVGAVLLLPLAVAPVRADGTVSAKFTDIQSGTGATDASGGGGGVFNFSNASYSSNANVTLGLITQGTGNPNKITPTSGTVFQTFCIETNEFVGTNTSYTYALQTDISKAPLTNGGQLPNGMGSAAAKNMELLFGKFYYNSTNGYASSIDYGALQLAIWTIVNQSSGGSSETLSVDSNLVSNNGGSSAQIVIDYKAMITYLQSSTNQANGPLANYLVALTSTSQQDQIGINVGGNNTPNAVAPCPPGIILGLIGIVGMGGYGWRRRRLMGR